MKRALLVLAVFTGFLGATHAANDTDTLLVCDGHKSSYIEGLGGPERRTFVIQKKRDKVVSVRTDSDVFTLDRVNVSSVRLN